jgi:methyl-accepting chemotaxis protein
MAGTFVGSKQQFGGAHMFGFGAGADAKAVLEAMSRSQAIIEFKLDGTIITANENFCRALGYQLAEIVGKHHRMFVDPTEVATADYRNFWARLACGEYDRRQYKRVSKDGTEIWIEASYNPVFSGGKPYKVVKFATDITAQKLKSAEDSGMLDAISRAQAVIEFTPNGDILTANENFLKTMGYQLSEVQGNHHSIFCEASYTNSEAYSQFWGKLAGGEFVSDEFMRLGKGGKRVFIQASYNPIFDMNGNVFKVVKFATDVTTRVGNVDQLAGALNALSEGDLTQSIATPFLPALEKLRVDFNGASSKLRSTLQTISQNAGAIAAASQQIQSASNDLSKRTEQQAASVEETAAALEEITTTVSDSSHRAQEAGQLVRRTKENAEHSGNVVGQAIEAMGKIEKSAGQIANIIGVIDDIAFQTNLLALNAGVEAARAGEAGRGFAVVAQEVRELAQRSATAAKEIKELINASNEHVKSGVALVGNTGKALQEIVTQVVQVDGNVGAIVEASKEQATGLKEINTAVNTMDQGTQQNAAMVEETTAAAYSLAREADQLYELLGQFNVGTGISAHRVAPTAANQQSVPCRTPPVKWRSRSQTFNGNAAVKAGHSWDEY